METYSNPMQTGPLKTPTLPEEKCRSLHQDKSPVKVGLTAGEQGVNTRKMMHPLWLMTG